MRWRTSGGDAKNQPLDSTQGHTNEGWQTHVHTPVHTRAYTRKERGKGGKEDKSDCEVKEEAEEEEEMKVHQDQEDAEEHLRRQQPGGNG